MTPRPLSYSPYTHPHRYKPLQEVGKLRAEIEELKAALAAAAAGGGGDGGGGGMSDAAKAQMQSQIDDYNLMLKQSFEEKERLAQVTAAATCRYTVTSSHLPSHLPLRPQ